MDFIFNHPKIEQVCKTINLPGYAVQGRLSPPGGADNTAKLALEGNPPNWADVSRGLLDLLGLLETIPFFFK
jgi:hypothetical protein